MAPISHLPARGRRTPRSSSKMAAPLTLVQLGACPASIAGLGDWVWVGLIPLCNWPRIGSCPVILLAVVAGWPAAPVIVSIRL